VAEFARRGAVIQGSRGDQSLRRAFRSTVRKLGAEVDRYLDRTCSIPRPLVRARREAGDRERERLCREKDVSGIYKRLCARRG
jgi:hypothetical protein